MSIRNLKEYLDNMQLTKTAGAYRQTDPEKEIRARVEFPGGCGTGIPVPCQELRNTCQAARRSVSVLLNLD